MLRGSGNCLGFKKNQSYSVYDKMDFDIPVGTKMAIAMDRYFRALKKCVSLIKLLNNVLTG